MQYIADSYDQAFRDSFADYIALAPDFYVSGAVVTEVPSGGAVSYSVTAGTACYKGEFLRIEAHSQMRLASQVIYFELEEDAVDLFPVLNSDGSSDSVMIRRRLRLRVGPVYPTDHMALTAPRKEELDRLRLQGRIVVPGSILPYFGSMVDFSATGLGSGAMSGWAVCNGLNGTPDMRGLVAFGATNVPSSGAPTLYAGIGGATDPGERLGADAKPISPNNLPPHKHDIVFPSEQYPSALQPGSAQFSAGTSHPYQEFPTETAENATTHTPFDTRQAGFAVVWIMSIV